MADLDGRDVPGTGSIRQRLGLIEGAPDAWVRRALLNREQAARRALLPGDGDDAKAAYQTIVSRDEARPVWPAIESPWTAPEKTA